MAPQPPGPPSGLLVCAPHRARRPASPGSDSPGRCTFAGDSLIQQTAVLLGGKARRQTAHKQRDARGQRPALSHVESCLAHLPQGHLQGGDTEQSPGDTPHLLCPQGARGKTSQAKRPQNRKGQERRDTRGPRGEALRASVALVSSGQTPCLQGTGCAQRPAAPRRPVAAPTDLPDLTKPVKQGFLVCQHRALDCGVERHRREPQTPRPPPRPGVPEPLGRRGQGTGYRLPPHLVCCP